MPTEEGVLGYFPENEPIWLFTDKVHVKQEIEDGLNRAVTLIRTPDEFVAKLSDIRSGNIANTSLIITDSLPVDIEANFSAIVRAIKVLTGVKVLEIGIDPIFPNAKAFGTIPKMIKFAQESRRAEQIRELDPKDSKTQLIEGLQIDLNAAKGRVDKLLKECEKLGKERDAYIAQVKDLKGEINHTLTPDLNRFKELSEALETKVNRLDTDLRIEQEKAKNYLLEKDKLLSEKTDLEYKVRAYEGYVEERGTVIDRLKEDIKRLTEDVKRVEQEKVDMLRTLVDEEIHEKIQKELGIEREHVRQLTSKVDGLQVELASKSIMLQERDREITELRKGSEVLSSVGITSIIDSYDMERTNLVYIKVINELSYHRLAVQYLFDELAEHTTGLSHLAILRTDEGLDNKIYHNIPLVGKIEDVEPNHRVFRLFPNRAMFTGAERFLRNVDLLVVVDYMRNDKYCLSSKAKEVYMTMVQRSSDIKKYDLKGMPISLDEDSVFDIKWDSRIANSAMQENRHDLLKVKVQDWVAKLGVY